MPVSVGTIYRVQYEIDDATTDEEGHPDIRPSTPSVDVNYGAAIVAICRTISPIYARIAVGILNPHTEAGRARHVVFNIKKVKDMLSAIEHLARSGQVYTRP